MKKIRAIRHNQNGKYVYSLSIQGNEVLDIASVDNVRRDENGILLGYQRVQIKKHIKEITEYMNKSDAILPNAIVVCFDSIVKFEEISDGMGYLIIPDDKIHGFIVDGQQRSTALFDAEELKNKTFEVAVNAFIADEPEIQREQFMLVNNSKPLPKTLLNELMPNTSNTLPKALEEKKLPNMLIQELNRNEHSVFFNRIRTHTCSEGYITENSLLLPIKASLDGHGCLFEYTSFATGKETNIDAMLQIIDNYFTAIGELWSEDFNLKPRLTRLTHGGGIKALFDLLDAIHARIDKELLLYTIEDFKNILISLTLDWRDMKVQDGRGNEISIMELQNNSKDKAILSNYLLRRFFDSLKKG